ncbi:hypothetical protein Plhal304r1_c023g0079261 [Plasmopara halstedii]
MFGFPGALQKHRYDHRDAIIPQKLLGNTNQIVLWPLSGPGLSENAVMCTKGDFF